MTDTIIPTDNESISFDTLNLARPILSAIAKSGYTTPTPIQAQAIPLALDGHDLLLSAQTGSGKTAAFVLPILDKLAKTPKKSVSDDEKGNFSQKSHQRHQKIATKALILTPTRELALQVQDNVRKYGSELKGVFSVPLVGGAPYGGQIRALRKGVQIIVATPGRLLDHLNDERVDLSELDYLVLDEADRMLDMGFSDAINAIIDKTPSTRQTIMSSATWDGQVGEIAKSYTKNPHSIAIKVETAHIDESVFYCDDFNHKNKILVELLNNPEIGQAVIFTATKNSSERLAEDLIGKGYKARYLHGDLPQGKRNRIIQDVKSGKCQFLIATDVAARGIDIVSISHVINYDLPRQVEDYVHRIGRSGRAGRTGVAMNLCSLEDKRQLKEINRYLKRTMTVAMIDGLEPKKLEQFENDDRRDKKSGRFHKGGQNQRGRGRHGERFGFDRRAEFRQAEKDFKHDFRQDEAERSPFGRQDFDKPKFDKSRFDKSGFDKQGFYDKNKAQFDKRTAKGKMDKFNKTVQDGFERDGLQAEFGKRRHDDFAKDGVKERGFKKSGFGQDEFKKDNPKKGTRHHGDKARFGGRGNDGFDGKNSGGFDARSKKRQSHSKQTNDGFHAVKRKKGVEEVLFHHTAKKSRHIPNFD